MKNEKELERQVNAVARELFQALGELTDDGMVQLFAVIVLLRNVMVDLPREDWHDTAVILRDMADLLDQPPQTRARVH